MGNTNDPLRTSSAPADVGATPPADRLLVLSVLAGALALRLAGLNAESFSMDEVTDLGIARLPLQQIVVLPDGFPPLYQILLKGWLYVWKTPMAARWLPALLGVVTVYAVYRLALAAGSRRGAIAAGILAAISPLHVWFAQESRAYALALPVAALALWRFYQAYLSNTLCDWLIYAGIAIAALWTHYFLSVLLLLQALWLLPRWAGAGYARRPSLIAYSILALFTVPVMLLLRSDLAYQSGTGHAGTSHETIGLGAVLYTLYAFFLGFATGPSVRELHNIGLREAGLRFLPWIAALLACLLPLGLTWLRRSRTLTTAAGYLLLCSLGPIALTVVFSALFELKYKVSYVAWASIPFLVLLGLAVATSWNRWFVRLGLAGYVCLALMSLSNRHLVNRYRNEDVRSVAVYLQRHSSPRTPVLVLTGYMTEPLLFYLGKNWSVKALSNGSPESGTLPRLTETALGDSAWVVYTRAFDGDPSGRFHAQMVADNRIRLSATFAGIELYLFDGSRRGRPRL